MENATATYLPSSYFYRAALRNSASHEEAKQIGLHAVAELERLKAWVREHGLIPPKWFLMQSEIDLKGWGAVVPFPSAAELRPSPDDEL